MPAQNNGPSRLMQWRRSYLFVWVSAATLVLLIWAGISYKIAQERQVELAAVDRETLNLARVFEEHTIRTIQGIDQSVLFLKYQYEKIGEKIAIANYVKEGMIQASLFNQLGIIDEQGIYTHSSLGTGTGINLSDREHFKVHIPADSGQLFISKPLLGRASGKWSLQLSRRINKKDGSFDGAVVVSLNPEYLTTFYRQVDIGTQGIVALIGADGIVRARRQGDEVSYGQDLSASPVIKKAMAEEQGTTVNVSRIDGVRRLYGYRKVKGYPLWVFVALGEDEALEESHNRGHIYQAFGGLMTVLILGFALAVTLILRRQYQTAEDLRLSQGRAEAANIAKSQFLATMSHEIRTPMNGILGMAQLLLMPELKDSERSEFARTILNSGNTLMTLLNDILDLSKVEAGKLELTKVVFNSKQVVDEVASLFAEQAHVKGLTLEAAWHGPAEQRYRGDAVRVRQMMSNFISNAIKFTANGFVRLDVSEVSRSGHQAILEYAVSDSGIGIPPEKLAILFQPFTQADSSTTREYGGTGLGLSIVKSLAHLMGGEVGATSEPGKGSRFCFSIQAEVVMQDEESRHAEREPAVVSHPQHASNPATSILIVEDNPTNRIVVAGMLKKLGWHSESVENGQLAVDLVTQGSRPALVLMDLQMPVMDGLTATRAIRQWESENPHVRLPIVALTADAFEIDQQHCTEAGMDDFMTKPIDFAVLQAMLEKWVTSKMTESPRVS